MFVVKHRKIFYIISALLVLSSIFSLFKWGLKPSIDFKGGSILSVEFEGNVPTVQNIRTDLSALGFSDESVRSSGTNGYIIRLSEINQDQKNAVLAAISENGTYKPVEKEFSTVGPILGREVLFKSYISVILVLLCIVLFITFAFRKVSKPVSSWLYGIVAIIALLHDILIPAGVFSILGHFAGFEVDTLFVTALLVILGFSIHDTIVIFDRVRENLSKHGGSGKKPFSEIVGESISETFVRSINTSLTTLLAIVMLYFFGPEATRHFSLACVYK